MSNLNEGRNFANSLHRRNSMPQFSSLNDEINNRFQIPRQQNHNESAPSTSTCESLPSINAAASTDFNPRKNYSFRRPVRRGGRTISSVSSKNDQTKSNLIFKDVCLLPSPSWDQVPRGQAKVKLLERGLYVDCFKLDKEWGECRLYQELNDLFKDRLKLENSESIG